MLTIFNHSHEMATMQAEQQDIELEYLLDHGEARGDPEEVEGVVREKVLRSF